MTASQQVSLREYLAEADIPAGRLIHIMMGDLQRIREYSRCGFQIPMTIPEEVWAAWEQLVKAGFDRHLLTFKD
jgi:hypothetical protein